MSTVDQPAATSPRSTSPEATPPAAPKGPAAPAAPAAPGIDPRGPQVAAAITTLVLAAILLTAPGPVGIALLVAQTLVFAVGAARGVQHTAYSWVFRRLVRPRLAPPAELEDPRPPRFAQTVGLAFAVTALVGFATGATLLGQIAAGFALAAAFLNAAFAFCLGCEMYLLIKRAQTRLAAA